MNKVLPFLWKTVTSSPFTLKKGKLAIAKVQNAGLHLWTFDEKKEYFSLEDKHFHTLKIPVGAFTFLLPRKKPSPVASPSPLPVSTNGNNVPRHSLNSPADAQVGGDRPGQVRFPFGKRVIPCLLCFITEMDSETVYLNGCLVAVIAEGLGLVTLELLPDLSFFFCYWEITRLGKLGLDFPNCSSGCLKPTPEFLAVFYKYSTLHEPQVLTETPFNLLCYV